MNSGSAVVDDLMAMIDNNKLEKPEQGMTTQELIKLMERNIKRKDNK